LRSALEQRYVEDIELIVIDDGPRPTARSSESKRLPTIVRRSALQQLRSQTAVSVPRAMSP
jgi:hypothetical protein